MQFAIAPEAEDPGARAALADDEIEPAAVVMPAGAELVDLRCLSMCRACEPYPVPCHTSFVDATGINEPLATLYGSLSA